VQVAVEQRDPATKSIAQVFLFYKGYKAIQASVPSTYASLAFTVMSLACTFTSLASPSRRCLHHHGLCL
jgi:hypothetical protein